MARKKSDSEGTALVLTIFIFLFLYVSANGFTKLYRFLQQKYPKPQSKYWNSERSTFSRNVKVSQQIVLLFFFECMVRHSLPIKRDVYWVTVGVILLGVALNILIPIYKFITNHKSNTSTNVNYTYR